MSKISLFFSESYELYRLVANHRLISGEVVSTRGKVGLGINQASFQWTNAVKALVVLLSEKYLGNSFLTGAAGSPAASLDFAISKQPTWIREIFGNQPARAFKRVNSERKIQEEVRVGFSSALDNLSVEIFLVGKKASASEVRMMKDSIVRGFCTEDSENSSYQDRFNAMIRRDLSKELVTMLGLTDIFSKSALKIKLNKLCSNPCFNAYLSGNSFDYSEIDFSLSCSGRLGLHQKTQANRTFSVAASATLVSALALFRQANFKRKTFDVNYSFPHAVEIVRQLLANEFLELPDLLILGSAPAAHLLSSTYSQVYEPLMFLPMVSHGIVSCKRDQSKTRSGSSDYMFIAEDPSLPAMIYDRLILDGYVSSNNKTVNLEPDETFMKLRSSDADLNAILFFPHYNMNLEFNNCSKVEIGQELLRQEVLLLARKDLTRAEKILVNCKVRDAWLSLISSSAQQNLLMDDFMNDSEYLSLLYRISGAYGLEARNAVENS